MTHEQKQQYIAIALDRIQQAWLDEYANTRERFEYLDDPDEMIRRRGFVTALAVA